MNKPVPQKAYFLLPLGLIAISFSSILIKLCDAPVFTIAVYRLSIASLFFIGINKIKHRLILEPFSRTQLRLAILSGMFLTIHFATWIASLRYTSVASSVVLVQTAPIFVAFGAFFFLKERLSWQLIIGILITVGGGSIIGLLDVSANSDSLRGDLLAVAGAIGASGYLLIGRLLRANIDIFRYVTVVYSATSLFLIVLAFVSKTHLIGFSPLTYLLLIAIAFVPQVIGHTTINWILEYFSASAVSVIVLAEPIGATILAYFILSENVTASKISGAAVILTGVLITLQAESKEYQRR